MSDFTYFSYSTAAELITKSPAHALLKKTAPKGKPTPAQIEGTIIHSMLLGADAGGEVVMVPFDNYRKAEAQAQRDAALAEGKTPMTMPQMMALSAAADAIRANLADLGVKLDGKSEVPIEWEERARDGSIVKCRGKLDHLKGAHIIDLKSVSCASLEHASRQIYTLGYDIQYSAYTSGFRKKFPDLAGREKFTFAFFELEPPYSVTLVSLDGNYRHIGDGRWRRAVDIWAECVASGHWPHYADREVQIAPPAWASIREDSILDREMDAEVAP